MFEINKRDGLARLGKIKTSHGILNTPTLLPVVNPKILTLSMKELKEFIDEKDDSKYKILESNKELLNNIPQKSVFIDIGFRKAKFPKSDRWAPCITAQPNMWCVPKERKANVKEYLMLQGFPTDIIQPISDHRMKILIGNSMTVNVIEELLLSGLRSLNIII